MNELIRTEFLTMGKDQILAQASEAIANFDTSLTDPIKQLAIVKKLQLLVDTLEKGIKEKTLEELERNGGKYVAFNCDFQVAEVGVKYDYSSNAKWCEVNAKIKELEEERKGIEAFIKTIKSYKLEVDPETGEQIEWFPAVKSSTTSIKTTIK